MNQLSRIVYVLFLLSFCTVSSAEKIEWKMIGPGDADQVTSVSVLTNGNVIIGTDIGGLYLSDDHGVSWQSRNKGLLNYDVTTPVLQDGKTLFVGTRGGLYKSNDTGKTWRNIRAGLPGVLRYKLSGSIGAIAINPNNKGGMLLGFGYRTSADGSATVKKQVWGKNLYISDNYGEHWRQIKAFGDKVKVYQIKYSLNGSKVYVATSKGLYQSQDGVSRWKKILNKSVYNIVLYPDQNRLVAACGAEGVYSTDDNGGNWSASNEGLSLGFPHELLGKKIRYSMLVKDPSDETRLLLLNSTWGRTGGLYISSDIGKSWKKYKRPFQESWLKTSKKMNSIAFDKNDSSYVYMGSSRYMYRSIDGGKNWYQAISSGTKGKWSHTGINVFGHTRDFLVDPNNPNTYFIATADHGMVISKSSGKYWQKANTGLRKIASVWDLEACTNEEQKNFGNIVLLAALKDKTSCFSKSDNGGESWLSDCTLNNYIDRPIKIIVDQSSCNTMYIGARNGLFKTTDNGDNWTQVFFGQKNAAIKDIKVDELSNVLVATKKGLYSVNKDGDVLNKKQDFYNKEVTNIFISQHSPQLMFAGVKKSSKKGSALFRSVNGGVSWKKVLVSTGFYSGMVQQNKTPFLLYVATNDHNFHDESSGNGVYVSNDVGETWKSINSGLPVLRAWNLSVGSKGSNKVYLSANGSGVYELQ